MRSLFSVASQLMLLPFLVLKHFDTVERIEKLLAREEDEHQKGLALIEGRAVEEGRLIQ